MYDKVSILDEIQNTPYYGRGTYTSKALLETATHSLQVYLIIILFIFFKYLFV